MESDADIPVPFPTNIGRHSRERGCVTIEKIDSFLHVMPDAIRHPEK